MEKQRTWTEWNDGKIERLARWICEAEGVIWFTGAGISTESGLPDYRGPLARRARASGKGRHKRASWKNAQPNAAHQAIVEFERIGKCDLLISQNIDNLHLKSGFPPEKLIELHGNKYRLRCRDCGATWPREDVPKPPSDRLTAACPTCGGCLRSTVIGFGDRIPQEDLDRAFEWARRAQIVIVVGSTCEVIPAADIPRMTHESQGRVAIVNIGKTEADDICDLRFSDQKAGELLPALLAKVNAVRSNQ